MNKYFLIHLVSRSVLFMIVVPGIALAQVNMKGKPLVSYTINELTKLQAGEQFNIVINLSVEPEWYIYAPTGTNAAQGMIETQVVLVLPDGLNKMGKMQIPDAMLKDGYEVFAGNGIVMSQPLKAMKPGSYFLKGRIVYQTCSTGMCLPPVTEEFNTTLNIN